MLGFYKGILLVKKEGVVKRKLFITFALRTLYTRKENKL